MYIEERGYINIYRERERDREKWLGDRSIDRERERSGGGKGERLGER